MESVLEEMLNFYDFTDYRPAFTELNYIGFRPFDSSYSGTRQIDIDFDYYWQPYLDVETDDDEEINENIITHFESQNKQLNFVAPAA